MNILMNLSPYPRLPLCAGGAGGAGNKGVDGSGNPSTLLARTLVEQDSTRHEADGRSVLNLLLVIRQAPTASEFIRRSVSHEHP